MSLLGPRRPAHRWNSPHERARVRSAERLAGPLNRDEEAWLEQHLAECASCAAIAAQYASQRDELRALAAQPVEPPRDLWARTAAAIERESRSTARRQVRHWSPIPVGIGSGVLVVAVVVAASLMSQAPATPPLTADLPSSPVATVTPGETPLSLTADVGYVRKTESGAIALYLTTVNEVCPGRDGSGCAPLDDTPQQQRPIANVEAPSDVVLSPNRQQVVVVDEQGGGNVYVMPVPTSVPAPGSSPSPTVAAASPTATPTPSLSATPSLRPSASVGSVSAPPASSSPSVAPSGSATASPSPSVPASVPPSPAGSTAIARDVVLVGEAAYSADGQWFAFSARPSDGSHGPDIYLWRAGDEEATPVTADHRSVFSAWFGTVILGSRLDVPAAPQPSPDASGSPSASASAAPTATARPSPTRSAAASSSPDATSSGGPSDAPSSSPPATISVGAAFIIDPATRRTADIPNAPFWRPAVDPNGVVGVYWRGGVTEDPSTGGTTTNGQLVVGPWPLPLDQVETLLAASAGPSPSPSATTAASAVASASATEPPSGSASPSASDQGAATASPSASVDDASVALANGPVSDWDARFDATGTRLAVWIADPDDPRIGRLSLYVVDPATGRVNTTNAPLADVPALPGFSLATNHLAWVTPPGQDGRASRVQVLAWKGDEFGSIESPEGAFIVVR